MRTKIMKVEILITVPVSTTVEEIEEAINGALDEPPCDWDDWTVGRAIVVDNN